MVRFGKVLYIAIFLSYALFVAMSPVIAQEGISYSVANYVTLAEGKVDDGSIVSANKEQFSLSSKPFDENMVGVVSQRPAISFIDSDIQNKTAVVSSGNAYLLVSAKNGDIKKGDALTSSDTKGVAMKADRPGNIIGKALEDFAPSNKEQVQKIYANIDIRFWSEEVGDRSVFDLFKLSLVTAASEQPPIFFKYTTAAFSVLGSILLGFYFFGKVAAKGVEAIGRNPLAGKMIQLGIMFNVFLTVVTISAGLIIAIVILRL